MINANRFSYIQFRSFLNVSFRIMFHIHMTRPYRVFIVLMVVTFDERYKHFSTIVFIYQKLKKIKIHIYLRFVRCMILKSLLK